jgi:hypothetical protein
VPRPSEIMLTRNKLTTPALGFDARGNPMIDRSTLGIAVMFRSGLQHSRGIGGPNHKLIRPRLTSGPRVAPENPRQRCPAIINTCILPGLAIIEAELDATDATGTSEDHAF